MNGRKGVTKLLLTVGLASSRAVGGAEARLCLFLAHLELLGVGQQCPAGVPEPLLLPRAVSAHVKGHPWRPRGVAPHLRACLQVASLVLLQNRVKFFLHTTAGHLTVLRSPERGTPFKSLGVPDSSELNFIPATEIFILNALQTF